MGAIVLNSVDPNVRVKDLYRVLKLVYDHPTLELYQESDLIYYFPKLLELPPWDKCYEQGA